MLKANPQMKNDFKEIEVRFLEIDIDDLTCKLKSLGAKDLGENLLKEVIFYDKQLKWLDEEKFVRVRQTGSKVQIAYKHHQHNKNQLTDVTEIELVVESFDKAVKLFEEIGLINSRAQEKLRRTFKLDHFVFDFDSWPSVPTYLEIEGPSEKEIKKIAKKLGLDWSKVVFEDAAKVLNHYYKISVKSLKYFTFDRVE